METINSWKLQITDAVFKITSSKEVNLHTKAVSMTKLELPTSPRLSI